MKLLTEYFYRDLQPLFLDYDEVILSAKSYSGEFTTKFYALNLSTGMVAEKTLYYQAQIGARMLSKQITRFKSDLSLEPISDDEVYLRVQQIGADQQTALYTSTGARVLQLPKENLWNLNFRVLEGLILVLTGKIDGNQFIQGIAASRDKLGLSERKFELVKNGKIMRLFTGGIAITDVDGSDVKPHELLKV